VLKFCLVDPSRPRILSTSDVPPQRLDWLWPHYRQRVRQLILDATPLIADLANVVASYAFEESSTSAFILGQAQAEADRTALLKERSKCERRMYEIIYRERGEFGFEF